MMKRSSIASAVLTCLLTGSALAADLPTKAAPYRNYQPGAFSWNGFYVGGVAGAGIVTPLFADFNEFFSFGNMHAGDWAGTAGATIGYNWQFGSGVFGVEADFNWTSFNKKVDNPAFESRFDAKWNWFSTIRARAGVAFDRALVYATAGVALVDQDYQVFFPGFDCEDGCTKLKKTEVGLALGAGAEYAFANNWSLKAEYLFIKLPTKETGLAVDPDEFNKFQFTTDAHFARIGLNYRFGY